MNEHYKERKTCRLCHSPNLVQVLSLGNQHVVNFVDSPDEKAYKAPLDLLLCKDCKLLQLKHTVDRDILYRQYWYFSGINTTMRESLLGLAKEVSKRALSLTNSDIIVDIGSNDGTMLRAYPNGYLVGFEPAKNLAEEGGRGLDCFFNDYFNAKVFKEKFGTKKAKVITAIAMFYDLEEPDAFVEDVKEILDGKGIFVIQMNYLPLMLLNHAFDNISHEHLEYYSLMTLEVLLAKHDLEVFDVELNDINGGSLRVWIKHKSCELFPVSTSVASIRYLEKAWRLDDQHTYDEFQEDIYWMKMETMRFLEGELAKGKKIYLYGASTRGLVTLQFYGINKKHVVKAAERNPAKYGKTIVGTGIPIASEEECRKEEPDYFFVLPWQFLDEFMKRESDFLEKGGKFIVSLPYLRVIGKS